MGMKSLFIAGFFNLFVFIASADLVSDVNDVVQSYHERQRFHGNVIVKYKGETLIEKSVGLAVAEWTVPHSADSKFMIASLSKSFTSALVLILQNQGKLSIEDLVSNYILLPKDHKVNLEKWNKLKIKDLMGHRGAIKRNFEETAYLSRSSYNLTSAILQHYFREKDPFIDDKSPGETFNYSNFGYLLLVEVIESVSIGFYENELKSRIFNPLKMKNTGEFHRGRFIRNMSSGYHYNEDSNLVKRCCDDATVLRGAASLYSTTQDLGLWLSALKNSKEVFGFDLLSEFFSTSSLTSEETLYGLGLNSEIINGSNRVSHIGHEWGYTSLISFYPEHDLEVVVLSNRHNLFDSGQTVDRLSKEIEALILD